MYFHFLLSSLSESNICYKIILVDEPIFLSFIVSDIPNKTLLSRCYLMISKSDTSWITNWEIQSITELLQSHWSLREN